MHTYLLIGCELAVLYTVFWYLYVRNPKCKRHISASMWGTYKESLTEYGVDPTLQLNLQQMNQLYPEHCPADNDNTIDERYIWDAKTNRYIPVDDSHSKIKLLQLAAKLDQTFSQLNVRE